MQMNRTRKGGGCGSYLERMPKHSCMSHSGRFRIQSPNVGRYTNVTMPVWIGRSMGLWTFIWAGGGGGSTTGQTPPKPIWLLVNP